MNRFQSLVRDFHRGINQPISPAEPQLRNARLRAQLIAEEAIETVFALVGAAEGQVVVHDLLRKVLESSMQRKETSPDLCRAIDGVCDTVVVCMGTAEAFGVDITPFYEEVMRANLAKVGGPIDANGKQQKPPGWTPPDIQGVLNQIVLERSVATEPARVFTFYDDESEAEMELLTVTGDLCRCLYRSAHENIEVKVTRRRERVRPMNDAARAMLGV